MSNSSITLTSLANTLGISSLTEDTTPDAANDFVATYDASAGANKKVKLVNIPGASMVKLASTTASNSASIAFTGLSSAYNSYVFVISALKPATDAVNLLFQASTDGGSTYYSTNEYHFSHQVGYPSDGSYNNHGGTASATFQLTGVTASTVRPGNDTNENVGGVFTLINPSATTYGRAVYQMSYTDSAGAFYITNGGGTIIAAADIDAVKFLFASGNITSGTITMYGVK